MSAHGPGLKAQYAATRDRLHARWLAMPVRERMMTVAAASLVAVALIWTVTIQPALTTIKRAQPTLDQLDGQLQTMQRLAEEANSLTTVAPVQLAESSSALKVTTERLGERVRLNIVGDRATVVVTNVTGEMLGQWLAEVRSAARARPVEMQLTRSGQGYSGTIAIALGGGA